MHRATVTADAADCKLIEDTLAMDSSIDVLVPSIAPLIDQWYRATPGAIDGMPPHITLLWPWLPAPVSDDDISAPVGPWPASGGSR